MWSLLFCFVLYFFYENTNILHIKMSSAIFGRLRQRARVAVQTQHTRRFGGGGPPPQYEGIEATVRQYLPEDHHVVLATLGAWAAFIGVMKLSSGGAAEAAPASASSGSSAAADDEIPSIFSDKFDESMSEKWEASIPKWEKDMENADYAARWEKSLA